LPRPKRGETSPLATWGAELAGVLYEARHYDEAVEWLRVAGDSAGDDDLDAMLARQPVEAKMLARHGRIDEAERLARTTVDLAARTDALNRCAESLLALADVLELAGSDGESRDCVEQALRLYKQKGNVAAAARVREKHEEPIAGLFVRDAGSS
jgi:tetratricopeptide (TPR) repeat protein